MNLHHLNLQDATTIGTQPFVEVQQAVSDLVDARAMGAFVGDAGLGKTFAVETARSSIEIDNCRVVIPVRATMRKIAMALLRQLTGVTPTGERFQLADELIDVLAEKPRLVVIDEAQNASHDCIEFLRHIHDDPDTDFALALTGGHRCWEVLQRYPMLHNRIYRRVEFSPMDLSTVYEAIPNFHRIYDGADAEVLTRIYDEFAGGVFRLWTAFTVDAVKACAAAGRDVVDDVIVDDVIQMRAGRRAALAVVAEPAESRTAAKAPPKTSSSRRQKTARQKGASRAA